MDSDTEDYNLGLLYGDDPMNSRPASPIPPRDEPNNPSGQPRGCRAATEEVADRGRGTAGKGRGRGAAGRPGAGSGGRGDGSSAPRRPGGRGRGDRGTARESGSPLNLTTIKEEEGEEGAGEGEEGAGEGEEEAGEGEEEGGGRYCPHS
uniref:Uncharacterized protein n=1 Tax=Amphimedon queenslandica TaxID=400682 RepID=A0A1X7UKX0_AMPQE